MAYALPRGDRAMMMMMMMMILGRSSSVMHKTCEN